MYSNQPFFILSSVVICLVSAPVKAEEMTMHHDDPTIFHAITLEGSYGSSEQGGLTEWELEAWVGSDMNKLWINIEGEKLDGESPEQEEYWAMISHQVSDFFDAQLGVRFDNQPEHTGYLVAGINGLAPYFFETGLHLFLSDDGDVSARLKTSRDLLLTQRLITAPYLEVNLAFQDVAELGIGAGLTEGEIGLQTRYEIRREFAPYIDLRVAQLFGETASRAEENTNASASLGLRVMY